jgi:hypothetical protein
VTVTGQRFLSCTLGIWMFFAFGRDDLARADVLVLDACVEHCSEADWRAIESLRRAFSTEIENRAVIANVEDLVHRLDVLPLPGISDPSLTVAKLTKRVKSGIDQWTQGDYEGAAASLEGVLNEAADNPAIVAADSTLRPLIVRAYVARAVSVLRLSRPNEPKDARMNAAKNVIADLVRITTQSSIQDTAGTVPDRIFQAARSDLMARGMGRLSIQINDPSTVFYLNVAGESHTGAFAGEVFPGVYQVFVADAAKRSRRYQVEVAPHKHTVLNLDWRIDARFEVLLPPRGAPGSTPTARVRAGFTFFSENDRRAEADLAGRFAARVPGALVLVVGAIKWEGKDAMIGVMYSPDGFAERVGVVRGLDVELARALASYLLTTSSTPPQVIALAAPPWATSVSASVGAGASAQRRDSGNSNAKGVLLGVGGPLLIAGAIVAVINLDGQTRSYGIEVGAAGLAAIGLGFWLGRDRSGPVVSWSSASASIGWAGSF